MVVLLKTTSVRVSFIQIMQLRVQNKGKSVWKSRYVGDVSITQRSYATTEKEFLVVAFACDKFRSCIIDSKIIVHTNHAAIIYLM